MDETAVAVEIVEGTGDAVICADADGDVIMWNEGAEEMFGYSADEAVGESLDLIVPERFRERHWEAFDRAMEREETTYDPDDLLAVPAARADGELISIEFTVTLVEDDDGIVGVGAIVRDVTERWEEEREREERIEELEARLEDLEGEE